MPERATLGSPITDAEVEDLREAFHSGRFEGVVKEHEGATQTFLFEGPSGYVGLSVGVAPGDDDLHVSVAEWEKRKHHEVDRWGWVRTDNAPAETEGES